jgi:hypothetical protein
MQKSVMVSRNSDLKGCINSILSAETNRRRKS